MLSKEIENQIEGINGPRCLPRVTIAGIAGVGVFRLKL